MKVNETKFAAKIIESKLLEAKLNQTKLIEEKSELDVLVLIILAIAHAIFSLSRTIFIIITPFGISNSIVTLSAIFVVGSFIIFRRCLATDMYEYVIKNFNLVEENLPLIARDNFMKKYLMKILHPDKPITKKNRKKKLRDLRLDILKNYKPLVNCKSEKKIMLMHNHKLHYIILNIIVIVMLLYKFNLQKMLPLLLIWMYTVFKM